MKNKIQELKDRYHNNIDTLTVKEANELTAEIKRLQDEYHKSLMAGVNTDGFVRTTEHATTGEKFQTCDIFVLERRPGMWEIGGTNSDGEFKRVQAPTHEAAVEKWNNKEYA